MDAAMNTLPFRKALEFTLKWEGGYVNDPSDPGGETKWGISKRAYPNLDIYNLTPEMAATIYYRDYFVPSGAVDVGLPDCIVVFDTAVNVGVGRCKSLMQEGDLLEARRTYYLNLVEKKPALKKYLKGWLNRLNDLKKYVDINTA
jgi:hypothetical protein